MPTPEELRMGELNLEKEKNELEKKKIEQENKKQNFETIKLLVVSVGVAILTLFVNYGIKINELDSAKYIKDTERLDKSQEEFYEIEFEASKLRRKRELVYKIVTIDRRIGDLDPDTKNKYDSLLISYSKSINSSEEKIDNTIEINKQLDSLTTSINTKIADSIKTKLINADIEINDLKKRKKQIANSNASQEKQEEIQKDIDKKLQEIKQIVDQNIIAKKAFKIDSTIEQNESVIAANNELLGINAPVSGAENSGKILIDERWFKDGYYRQYNDIRLVLTGLKENQKKAEIKIRVDRQPGDKEMFEEFGTYILEQNKSIDFEYNEATYTLTFQRIGRAGNNPFTKALYFRFERNK